MARGFVSDIGLNDLWYFPSGIPHSIQGLGPDGCEFLLVFDDGKFSEANTTLISDWTRHTPREVLAKNWGVKESAEDFKKTTNGKDYNYPFVYFVWHLTQIPEI
jgi:oxalate decarboxylase